MRSQHRLRGPRSGGVVRALRLRPLTAVSTVTTANTAARSASAAEHSRVGILVMVTVAVGKPASAGTTARRPHRASTTKEHPRVGGNYRFEHRAVRLSDGTPLRRRDHSNVPVTNMPDAGTLPRRRGPPCASGCRTWSTSEHPCVGGDHFDNLDSYLNETGTPPRRRGPQRGHGRELRGERNTPASAGTTASRRGRPASTTEHPRVGGDHTPGWNVVPYESGTPPRRRGPHGGEGRLDRYRRNTPASAGTTMTDLLHPRIMTEHPRVGGDHRQPWRGPGPSTGTPPRRRGPRHQHGAHRQPRRNTPASAGTTTGSIPCRTTRTEHPRVGGDHGFIYADVDKGRGSPRPVGGDHIFDQPFPRSVRGSPPRRRGPLAVRLRRLTGHRMTPASAGTTTCPPMPQYTVAEHPRIGGNHFYLGHQEFFHDGTSPRLREPRVRHIPLGFRDRNTPASAGTT